MPILVLKPGIHVIKWVIGVGFNSTAGDKCVLSKMAMKLKIHVYPDQSAMPTYAHALVNIVRPIYLLQKENYPSSEVHQQPVRKDQSYPSLFPNLPMFLSRGYFCHCAQ